ncbi:MAG: hemerythrin domain-containing protein [Propionibacteriaceae bacterium]|nr:hemerythrin domain-containing protein [Propionibacteriaceae bacterium]
MNQGRENTGTEPFGCATEDLLVVHRMFRKLFGQAPSIVRSTSGAGAKRLAAVEHHVLEIVAALHTHHHGEDVMLWERLEERAPACALHVERMRMQHGDISEKLDEVSARVEAWRGDRESGREPLAAALDDVGEALEDHLADEEATIRPVAAEYIRQSEWEGLAEHGFEAIPPNRRLVQLGVLLSAFEDDEQRRVFWQSVPAVARAMYRIFGARQLRKGQALLLGDVA